MLSMCVFWYELIATDCEIVDCRKKQRFAVGRRWKILDKLREGLNRRDEGDGVV
jgi:hypothetical protein